MTLISQRSSQSEAPGAILVEMEESLASKHPDLHRLLAFYQARRRPDGLLPRSAVQPRDLLVLLPSLYIVDPQRGGDWRFRLFGTGLVDRTNLDFTGKTVRAVYERASAARLIDLYDRVARERRSIMCRGRFLGIGLEHARAEALQIPMLSADGRTGMVLGGLFFF